MNTLRRILLLSAALLCATTGTYAQSPASPPSPTPAEILLWPNGAPGSEAFANTPEQFTIAQNGERAVRSIHHPSITPFLPKANTSTGAAVLIIPGGGHRILCVDHEGYNVARWLADHGIAGFVLKNRLAREDGSTYTIERDALADVQRALRLISSRANEWHIDAKRLGAIGFSAGGELVNLAALHPVAADPSAADPLDRLEARLAFQGLIYPGKSANILPTKDSPPAFLACGEKDRQDIAEGLPEAYLRFKQAGVSAELHVYADIGHGFGLRPALTGPVATWPDRLADWLGAKGFLTPKP